MTFNARGPVYWIPLIITIVFTVFVLVGLGFVIAGVL